MENGGAEFVEGCLLASVVDEVGELNYGCGANGVDREDEEEEEQEDLHVFVVKEGWNFL